MAAAGLTLTALPRHSSPVSKAIKAIDSAFRAEPFVMYGRHYSESVARAIRRLAPEADVLYLDHLDSLQYADGTRRIPIVADLHNVYSLLVEREAAQGGHSWLVRQYLAREARLLRRVEQGIHGQVSAVFAVSGREQVQFESYGCKSVTVVPNGVDFERFAAVPTGRGASAPIILFIGALSWRPNIAAVKFLADHALPAVRRHVHDARLVVVGSNPSAEVLALAGRSGVTIERSVPDVLPFLEAACLFAVPLESGGGTRLKILEAFAAGLPVVSTEVGCEGIEAFDKTHLRVASLTSFANVLTELLTNRAKATAMAGTARTLARDVYDWRVVGAAARQVVDRLLA
jgi:glycosyltransferase involved in cell wall biosynthesis